jgi:hypothetical protein
MTFRTVAASGCPRIRLRVFAPAQTLPMAHPEGTTNPGNFSLPGREHVVSEFFVEGYYMTGSDAGILNQRPTPHSPLFVIQYRARVRESAQRTIEEGGIPIIVKGLARDLHGSAELESWQATNSKLDHLVAGSLMFDPTTYVEDKELPGNWRSEFSNDRVHANLRGDQELCGSFKRLLCVGRLTACAIGVAREFINEAPDRCEGASNPGADWRRCRLCR